MRVDLLRTASMLHVHMHVQHHASLLQCAPTHRSAHCSGHAPTRICAYEYIYVATHAIQRVGNPITGACFRAPQPTVLRA